MNYVLLSGNSIYNKQWIYQLKDLVLNKDDKCYVHNYRHWDTDEDLIDFNYETKCLSDNIQDFSPFIILAKSVGDILALKLLKSNINKPVACLLLGLPIILTDELNISIDELLDDVDIPIIIAQNDNDPFGSYEAILKIINRINNKYISHIKFNGNTHSYVNFSEIKSLALKLTAQ